MAYEFKCLIIAVVRISVIGMFAFLNMRHLIESFHDARKNTPKKMVKCDDRGVLKNIIKTEPRKFDVLQVSLSKKSINASVQVTLEPAADAGSIDKEKFQKVMEINLKLENRLTELEEMIRRGDEKQKIRDLQLRQIEDFMLSNMTRSAHTQTDSELSLSTVQDLNDKVDKLSNYQQSLMEKINGELMTIGCDVKNIKNCYGVLNTALNELENKLIILGSNSEKPMRKYSEIKARIATLERDVMKNTSHVIGMDHSHRSLEWTRLQNFRSSGMFPPNNRCHGEPAAAFAATPSYYDMPPVSRQAPSASLPPSPPPPPPPSEFLPPPPSAPQSTSAFLTPSAPNTPKKTRLLTDSDKSSSSSVGTAKVEKVYCRIPITTEILKSVVLKPPGERKRVSKSAMIKSQCC